jgi:SAM-dependent methyltransferase
MGALASAIGDSIRRQFAQGLQENWRAAVRLCEAPVGGTLLDLGCGAGELTRAVQRKISAARTIGIDILRENIATLNRKGIEGIQSDLNKPLPLEDQSVDFALASHVIEYVADTDLFVSEVNRVLRAGGIFVIATPNLSAWPNVLFLLFGQQPPSTSVSDVAPLGLWSRMWGMGDCEIERRGHKGSNKHRRVFVRESLAGLLRYYGFAIERAAVSGFPPFSGVAAEVASRLFPVYAWQIVVRARKIPMAQGDFQPSRFR